MENNTAAKHAEAPTELIVCMDGHKPAIANWSKDQMKAITYLTHNESGVYPNGA